MLRLLHCPRPEEGHRLGGSPCVTMANRLLTDHLGSTEELESLLRKHLKPEERRL